MNSLKSAFAAASVLLCLLYSHAQEFKIDPSKYFTAAEINAANTASETSYLIKEEKNIFLYTNLARMYPKKYVKFYQDYLKTRTYLLEDYQSGNRYYTSLVRDLNGTPAMEALYPDKEMYDLAVCWAIEAGQSGKIGHDRVKCSDGYSGENCSYGYSDGVDIVMQLLIDKDVESLGHRKSILNSYYKGMGAAIRYHKTYTNNAVLDFSLSNDAIAMEEQKRENHFEELMTQWSASELTAADACRKLSYITDTEKDLYLMANLARMYPQKFKSLIWDKWNEYGPELGVIGEGEYAVDHVAGYKQVSDFLKTAQPGAAYIPDLNLVKGTRCLAEKWAANDESFDDCLSNYGWKLDSYVTEGAFLDKLYFLTEPDGGNRLILEGGVIVLTNISSYGIKAIVIP